MVEEGYILFVRKNAIRVLVPKFGLEGTVYLNEPGSKHESLFTYDAEVCSSVLFQMIVYLSKIMVLSTRNLFVEV